MISKSIHYTNRSACIRYYCDSAYIRLITRFDRLQKPGDCVVRVFRSQSIEIEFDFQRIVYLAHDSGRQLTNNELDAFGGVNGPDLIDSDR